MEISDILDRPQGPVEWLRQNGYKVRVAHKRIWQGNGRGTLNPISKRQLVENILSTMYPHPRGGLTRVEIKTPEGQELVGEAKCSVNDGYCRKTGVALAIERAFSAK